MMDPETEDNGRGRTERTGDNGVGSADARKRTDLGHPSGRSERLPADRRNGHNGEEPLTPQERKDSFTSMEFDDPTPAPT